MKGILLAGGHGTRLNPITTAISKHLLPIYDKPMVYYPLSILMLAEIKEVLIIATPEHEILYKLLLGDGSKFGMSFTYLVQEYPRGIADSFLVGEDFIGESEVCLILGDNIFHGQGLSDILNLSKEKLSGAKIFGHYVHDPKRFGIVEVNGAGQIISIEEKPQKPKSNIAITGLYFFDNSVVDKAKTIKPSDRGELEIASVLDLYLTDKQLELSMFGRGFAWLDTGTSESLLEASNFVRAIEASQGLKIACLEEIAFSKNWINTEQYIELANELGKSSYGAYMLSRLDNDN